MEHVDMTYSLCICFMHFMQRTLKKYIQNLNLQNMSKQIMFDDTNIMVIWILTK
jgi:hypothetical protein